MTRTLFRPAALLPTVVAQQPAAATVAVNELQGSMAPALQETTLSTLPPSKLSSGASSNTTVQNSLFPEALLNGLNLPKLTDSGLISLPGCPAGLSASLYVPLLHLYTSIQEADRLVHPFRKELALHPSRLASVLPHAITALTPSSKHANLYFKREDQTAVRAYKMRGAFCGMRRVMETQGVLHFVAASTGNHALGVLKAAELLRPKTIQIVVPHSTASVKLKRINSKVLALRHRGVEANVIYIGDTFDDAREWAMAQQMEGTAYYLDPYSNPWVVAGQGTIGLELLRQLAPLVSVNPELKEIVLVSPIGGGGLLAGTATALRLGSAWDHRFRNIQLKFVGLRLQNMRSVYGDAVRVKTIASGNQLVFNALDVDIQPIDDERMAEGMKLAYADLGDRVEGPSGATLETTFREHLNIAPSAERLVVCIVNDFPA
jgi:threonine synthase